MPSHVGIGNDELARAPAIAAGATVGCLKCGGEHVLVEAKETPPPDVRVFLRSLPKHETKPYLVVVTDSQGDVGHHRPCTECVQAESVEGGSCGFPHCCPHQGQDGGFVCTVCGERMQVLLTFSSDRDGGGRFHMGRTPGLCGPVKPDPDTPPWTAHYGKSARRETTLLLYECDGTTVIVGLNGKAIGGRMRE